MEWNEMDESNTDRCSTASSINSGEAANTLNTATTTTNKPGTVCNPATVNQQNKMVNGNGSMNQDSMSDGELSDFSLNDSDDEDSRSQSNVGEWQRQRHQYSVIRF